MNARRHVDEIPMDHARLRSLLEAQFPQWADLPIRELDERGTDHTLFRIGDAMVARMPIRPYAGAAAVDQQAVREARSLPLLAPHVPLEMPIPLGLGRPTADYPWHWSVVSWIPGERAPARNIDPIPCALHLVDFIKSLHSIDATDGPRAGASTGYRGTSLKPGAQRIRDAIERASQRHDLSRVRVAWEECVEAEEWDGPGVWFHGDLAGNLIARGRRVVGVIDSPYGVGDPACDLTPGWILFDGEARERFFDGVGLGEAAKKRARGWLLGPACIGLTYFRDVPAFLANQVATIEAALSD